MLGCVKKPAILTCGFPAIIEQQYYVFFLPLFSLASNLSWLLKGYFRDLLGKKSCVKIWSIIGFLPLGKCLLQNGFVLEHFFQKQSYPQVLTICLKPLQFASVSFFFTRAVIFFLGPNSLVTFSSSLGLRASLSCRARCYCSRGSSLSRRFPSFYS